MAIQVQIVGNLETHHDRWDVSKKLLDAGASRISILTREVTIEAAEADIPKIKKALEKLEIESIKIKESVLVEATVSRQGTGTDSKKNVEVVLMPGTKLTGYRLLSVLFSESFKKSGEKDIKKMMDSASAIVRDVLFNAGVTDVLYIIRINKDLKGDALEGALEIATLAAIGECEGVVQIN